MTAAFILLWWMGLDYYERREYFDMYKAGHFTKARNPYELESKEIEKIYNHYHQ